MSVSRSIFGATALHRRVPFNDAALDGRSIPIHFKADHTRTYLKLPDEDHKFADAVPWIVEGSDLLSGLVFPLRSRTTAASGSPHIRYLQALTCRR